ncbi:hypothetical protein DPMN_153878, partial [Dreissena polymorpha]
MGASVSATHSPMVEAFCCISCKERNLQKSAVIYCETCLRLYCKKCVIPYSQLFTKHLTCGRGDIKKWPGFKEVEDFLMKCDVHEDKTLTHFCHDHSQLCCSDCVVTIHRQCTRVTQISECSRQKSVDTNQLSLYIQSILPQLKSLKKNQKISMKSSQKTYRDHEQNVIEQMRQIINSLCVNSENALEQETLNVQIISVVEGFEKCTLKEIKTEFIFIKDSISLIITDCTRLQNELTHFHESIQIIFDHKELSFIAFIKCEQKIAQALKVLGQSGKVLTARGKYVHDVRILSDSVKCSVTSCCVLPDGQVLLLDQSNRKVKLLNQKYNVVSHCDLTDEPLDMCLTTPSEVAVTLENIIDTHEIQFIAVNQRQLHTGRKLQLQHKCICVAHHQGDLFICSYTALYKYSLSGNQVSTLYEDLSAITL